ncbi:hypothetical protein ACFXPL_25960, partial [Streptomyces sp. NPDC059092]
MSAVVTFAQAQERAEDWVNGDAPGYQHREVRVQEFELGFVAWAEDRENGPTSDGGRQRLVIARDSGEATLWPGLPVGEVIRRYEEEYGTRGEPRAAAAPEAPARIDLNQTSFLLTPPEWLQDAADKIGIPDRRTSSDPPASSASPAASAASGTSPSPGAPAASASGGPGGGSLGGGAHLAGGGGSLGGGASLGGGYGAGSAGAPGVPVANASQGSSARPAAYEPTANDGVPASVPGPPPGATPWTGIDTSESSASPDDGSVPLPATVFAPPLTGADDDDTPPPSSAAEAPTALMSGGSQLPRTAMASALNAPGAGTPGAPGAPVSGAPGVPAPGAPAAPGAPGVPGAGSGNGDIADAATSKAPVPPRGARGAGGGAGPPPPGGPGVPGAPPP